VQFYFTKVWRCAHECAYGFKKALDSQAYFTTLLICLDSISFPYGMNGNFSPCHICIKTAGVRKGQVRNLKNLCPFAFEEIWRSQHLTLLFLFHKVKIGCMATPCEMQLYLGETSYLNKRNSNCQAYLLYHCKDAIRIWVFI
jgi:hypothetical protein